MTASSQTQSFRIAATEVNAGRLLTRSSMPLNDSSSGATDLRLSGEPKVRYRPKPTFPPLSPNGRLGRMSPLRSAPVRWQVERNLRVLAKAATLVAARPASRTRRVDIARVLRTNFASTRAYEAEASDKDDGFRAEPERRSSPSGATYFSKRQRNHRPNRMTMCELR